MKTLQERYSTAFITEKYDITRQTLNNWIDQGLITDPERDWRGWRIWKENSLKEIEQAMCRKKKKPENLKILENSKLSINNRRYLGSKYKLIPFIQEVVKEECGMFSSFADIFAGTGVVAYSFNNTKTKIIANDILYSNYLAYLTWFGNEKFDKKKISNYIKEFNNIKVKDDNYFSNHFGDSYFTNENARKIGAIREQIELLSVDLTMREKAILITSLIYALDKVANTCGHYDAYRRKLDTTNQLKLQIPDIKDKFNSNNEIYKEDANNLVKRISSDITYIDTPYNSRQYSDTYHLLENIAEWKKPEVEGVAKKMVNRTKTKSAYCTSKAPLVFDKLISNINSKYILVSFNNMATKGVGRSNAKISDEEILQSLSKRGKVKVFDTDFQHFTTGKSKIEDHKERLFLCKCY